jgi:biopolymer transport protein ExbB
LGNPSYGYINNDEASMRRASAADSNHSRSWLKLTVLVGVLWLLGNVALHPAFVSFVAAQAETNPSLEPELEDVTPGSAGPSSASESTTKSKEARTFLTTIRDGGYIGIIIILLSMVMVGFIIEHSLTIRKSRLMPEAVFDQVEQLLAAGDVPTAIQACEDPKNYSLASEVMLAGLERYQNSEFGYAEYKSAAEEAGEEYTAKLYRKTDVLSVIGAIAPMLGLFGTVEGMIGAFNTIATSEGSPDAADLGGNIGKALITTWLGLVVAIPALIAFSFFRNKIDSLVAECGKRVDRVLMPLSRKR